MSISSICPVATGLQLCATALLQGYQTRHIDLCTSTWAWLLTYHRDGLKDHEFSELLQLPLEIYSQAIATVLSEWSTAALFTAAALEQLPELEKAIAEGIWHEVMPWTHLIEPAYAAGVLQRAVALAEAATSCM